VRINKDSHILGEINGGKIIIHEEARVDGAMRAANGVLITRGEMEEEYKTGGLLDMVPGPAVSKKTKATPDKIKADETVSGKTIDEATTTGSGTGMETRASEAVSYDIPAKRMTTAIKLGDIIKPVPAKKKTTTSTTTAKKKTTTTGTTADKTKTTIRTTADKKKTTTKTTADEKKTATKEKTTAKKTATSEKTKPKKTATKKKTTTKKAAAKEKTSADKSSTGKKTVKKKKDTKKKPAAKKKTTKKTKKK
jgi:hypothetical protein